MNQVVTETVWWCAGDERMTVVQSNLDWELCPDCGVNQNDVGWMCRVELAEPDCS